MNQQLVVGHPQCTGPDLLALAYPASHGWRPVWGRAKNWAILATRFRCDQAIYTPIMRTICGFVNV